MLSTEDRQLIAAIRSATGATNDSQLSSEELENELTATKTHLSNEIRRALETDTYSFYTEESAEKALFALMCLRISDRVSGGSGSITVSEARRSDFEDSQAAFWRDDLVRHLNRLTE